MSGEELAVSEFEWLANVYNLNSAINHPSELHGILIGELAGAARRSNDEWLELCLEHMGLEELNLEKQPGALRDLQAFYDRSIESIDSDSANFELCLPDDSYPISERGEALGLWVSGFLEGLAIARGKSLTSVDDDLKEILRDLVEISQLDAGLERSESAERDFFEVCEYVKIGVLNLYAEFNEPVAIENTEDKADASPTIH